MEYRSDIDGLRAFSVLSVIIFHSGFNVLSGGFIGVDVFFVISGYLITSLIYKELESGSFSFKSFYKRRAARLLPALLVTLLMVLLFGFYFYDLNSFDNLGKEIFFSSFGAANILFSQGVNYFANDESVKPLLHLWSLGVEEQFYIFWPFILIFCFALPNFWLFSITALLFFTSFILSITSIESEPIASYFLLQYRAFELILGSLIALLQIRGYIPLINSTKFLKLINFTAILLIILPVFLLDKNSSFPGFNALYPCFGAALLIAFPVSGSLKKIFSNKYIVYIGLISYPLYLFHQPILSFISFLELEWSPYSKLAFVMFCSTLLSKLVYSFFEKPMRAMAHDEKSHSGIFLILPFVLIVFAIAGLIIAKSNGLPMRFKYLNSFALEVSKYHESTFSRYYTRGYNVSDTKHASALFIGDSVLQHYIYPISEALKVDNFDMVTRGGCVLLKGVDFIDKYSDISCNNIREKLYSNRKTYDFVVISQEWQIYDDAINNFPAGLGKLERWENFIHATIEYYQPLANKIILIGDHPYVEGVGKIQPSIFLSSNNYLDNIADLSIKNRIDASNRSQFFRSFATSGNIIVIEPKNIFCDIVCVTNNGSWSYFSDSRHLTNASSPFLINKFNERFNN